MIPAVQVRAWPDNGSAAGQESIKPGVPAASRAAEQTAPRDRVHALLLVSRLCFSSLGVEAPAALDA